MNATFDPRQSLHISNMQDGGHVRGCFSTTANRDLPLTSDLNDGANVRNMCIGSPSQHFESVRHSQYEENVIPEGAFSVAQLCDGKSKGAESDFRISTQGCIFPAPRRSVLSGFGIEPDQNTTPYKGSYSCGPLSTAYSPVSTNTSLILELPSNQTTESVDSAGTQQSSITNARTPMLFSLSNHMASEAESYGSNASNFLEALMQVCVLIVMRVCLQEMEMI